MQPHNLFSLLTDRLLLYPNGFTMATYNVLYEVWLIQMKLKKICFAFVNRYFWKKSVD
jgi:hypothetical protein